MRTAVDHHVGLEPAAEAAAEQVVVDGHLVDRQARRPCAASDCTRAMICVPIQISQASGLTCTVQFIGSIVACARNGSS